MNKHNNIGNGLLYIVLVIIASVFIGNAALTYLPASLDPMWLLLGGFALLAIAIFIHKKTKGGYI